MKRAFSRKNIWEHTPDWAKSALGPILSALPPQWYLGSRFRAQLRFANEAQWWSADRIREYQIQNLRRLCELAYTQTHFYGERFREAGFEPGDLKDPGDLSELPTIDKQTLRDHLNDMCAAVPTGRRVDLVSTGGSSGEPLRFYIGADRSAIEYAYLVSGWSRIGYAPRIPQAVFRGQIVGENLRGDRIAYDPVLRRYQYSNFHMTDDNMCHYLRHIRSLGPCFLHVYPSSAATLARYLERASEPPPGNIRGLLAESEMVYSDDRMMIEEAFGARLFSSYGHSEKLVLATECEHSNDYHVWPTYGYFELLDREGHPIRTPGQGGEIAGTGFINSVVPFIRYRTGDFATYVADHCDACGRNHTVMTNVEGRWPNGSLKAHDGSAISMTAFNVHDDTFDDTIGHQFIQTRAGEAVLRVVPSGPLSEQDRHRILTGASNRLQGQVQLTLEICDELKRTPTGKVLRVVSRIDECRDGDRTGTDIEVPAKSV